MTKLEKMLKYPPIVMKHGYGITEDWKRLRSITEGCRDDMHEPDEQDLSAVVQGNHLDNAMGDDPDHNCGEYTVGITNSNGVTEWFSLANLIAMARTSCPTKKQ